MWSRISSLDQFLIVTSVQIRSGGLKRLEFVLRGISRAGDGYLWFALLAVSLVTGHAKAGIAGLFAAALGLSVSLGLKLVCRRPRPADSADWGRFLSPDRYSFPSGHTTAAFALATVTAAHWPAIAPALYIFAACIAASRTLLGFHYLSDVVAGLCLGLVSGLSAVRILS